MIRFVQVKRTVAILLIFLGGFGLPTALLSLASPFGAETSPSEAMLAIVIYIAMLAIGILIVLSDRKKAARQTNSRL